MEDRYFIEGYDDRFDNHPTKKNKKSSIYDIESGQLGNIPTAYGDATVIPETQYVDYRRFRGDYEDALQYAALNQPIIDKWGNGLGKFSVNFATELIDGTLGNVVSIANVMTAESPNEIVTKLFDNPISKLLNSWQDQAGEYFTNYELETDKEKDWYQKLHKANFWADDIFSNLGTGAGMVTAGIVTAGLGRIISGAKSLLPKLARGIAARYSDDIAKGTLKALDGTVLKNTDDILKNLAKGNIDNTYLTKELLKDAAKLKTVNIVNKAAASVLASSGEARLEALNTINEFYDELVQKESQRTGLPEELLPEYKLKEFNETAMAAGNPDFLLNLAVLSVSNSLQFGKLFSNYTNTRKSLSNIVKTPQGYATTLPSTASGRAGKRFYEIAKALKNTWTEGLEEQLQYGAAEASKAYAEMRMNGDSSSRLGDFFSSLGEGVSAMTSKEGWENFFVGAISAGIGMPTVNRKGRPILAGGVFSNLKDQKTEYKYEKEIVDKLNTVANSDRFRNRYKNVLLNDAAGQVMFEAAKDGDVKIVKDNEFLKMIDDVNTFIEAGVYEDFIDNLNSYKNTDAETIKELAPKGIYDNKSNDQIKAEVNDRVDSLLSQAANVKKIRDAIELKFPNIDRKYKESLTAMLATAENRDNRIKQIYKDLGNISSELESSVSNYYNKRYEELGLTNQKFFEALYNANKEYSTAIESNTRQQEKLNDIILKGEERVTKVDERIDKLTKRVESRKSKIGKATQRDSAELELLKKEKEDLANAKKERDELDKVLKKDKEELDKVTKKLEDAQAATERLMKDAKKKSVIEGVRNEPLSEFIPKVDDLIDSFDKLQKDITKGIGLDRKEIDKKLIDLASLFGERIGTSQLYLAAIAAQSPTENPIIDKILKEANEEILRDARSKEFAPYRDGVKVENVETKDTFTLRYNKGNYYLEDSEGNLTPVTLDDEFLDMYDILAVPTTSKESIKQENSKKVDPNTLPTSTAPEQGSIEEYEDALADRMARHIAETWNGTAVNEGLKTEEGFTYFVDDNLQRKNSLAIAHLRITKDSHKGLIVTGEELFGTKWNDMKRDIIERNNSRPNNIPYTEEDLKFATFMVLTTNDGKFLLFDPDTKKFELTDNLSEDVVMRPMLLPSNKLTNIDPYKYNSGEARFNTDITYKELLEVLNKYPEAKAYYSKLKATEENKKAVIDYLAKSQAAEYSNFIGSVIKTPINERPKLKIYGKSMGQVVADRNIETVKTFANVDVRSYKTRTGKNKYIYEVEDSEGNAIPVITRNFSKNERILVTRLLETLITNGKVENGKLVIGATNSSIIGVDASGKETPINIYHLLESFTFYTKNNRTKDGKIIASVPSQQFHRASAQDANKWVIGGVAIDLISKEDLANNNLVLSEEAKEALNRYMENNNFFIDVKKLKSNKSDTYYLDMSSNPIIEDGGKIKVKVKQQGFKDYLKNNIEPVFQTVSTPPTTMYNGVEIPSRLNVRLKYDVPVKEVVKNPNEITESNYTPTQFAEILVNDLNSTLKDIKASIDSIQKSEHKEFKFGKLGKYTFPEALSKEYMLESLNKAVVLLTKSEDTSEASVVTSTEPVSEIKENVIEQEELSEYTDRNVSKVEEFTFTREGRVTTYVQVKYYSNGKRIAYSGLEKDDNDNIYDIFPNEVGGEQSTEDYLKVAYPENFFGKYSKTGEKIDKETNLNNAELAALESEPTSEASTVTVTEPVSEIKEGVIEIESKKADIERRRQEELDKNSGKNKSSEEYLNKPMPTEEEELQKAQQIIDKNPELVKKLEDPNLSDEDLDKYDKELNEKFIGASSGWRYDNNGKVIPSIRKVQHGNIINDNFSPFMDRAGKYEVGDTIQVNNGTSALPAVVTKVTKYGRVIEAEYEGTVVIRNGLVLSANSVLKDRDINAKYDAELAALESEPTSEVSKETFGLDEDLNKDNEDLGFGNNAPLLNKRTIGLGQGDVTKAKEWVRSTLGNVMVEVFDKAKDNGVHGYLLNNLIGLASDAEVGTEYHEGMHYVYEYVLTEEERNNITKEIFSKKEYKNLINEIKELYPGLEDSKIASEVLAEIYRENKLGLRDLPKQGKVGKFLTWIKNLINRIRHFIGKDPIKRVSNINELIKNINTGYYHSDNLKNNKKVQDRIRENADKLKNVRFDSKFKRPDDVNLQDIVDTYQFTTEAMEYIHTIFMTKLIKSDAEVTVSILQGEDNGQIIEDTFNHVKNVILGNETTEVNVPTIPKFVAKENSLIKEGRSLDSVPQLKYKKYYEHLVNNWEETKSLYKDYLKKFNIKLVEEENIDDDEANETGGKGEAFAVKAITISAKANASNLVKFYLSAISDTEMIGGKLVAKQGGLGGYRFLSYNDTYSALSNILVETPTDKILSRLQEYSNTIPWINRVINRFKLDVPTEKLSAFDMQIRSNFYKAFSKQRVEYEEDIVNTPNETVIVNNSDLTTSVIKSTLNTQWRNNFLKNLYGGTKVASIQNGVLKYNLDKFKQFKSNPTHISYTDRDSSNVNVRNSASLEFLELLGIKLSNFDGMFNEDKASVRRISSDILGEILKNNVYIFSTTADSNVGGWMNELMDIEYRTGVNYFENKHRSIDGKTVYNNVSYHYLAKSIDKMNNSTLEELANYPSWNSNNPFVRSSLIIQNKLSNPNFKIDFRMKEKFSYYDFNGRLKEVEYRRATDAERVILQFHNYQANRFSIVQPSDNTHTHTISIGDIPSLVIEDGQILSKDNYALKYFYDSFVDEVIFKTRINRNDSKWSHLNNHSTEEGTLLSIMEEYAPLAFDKTIEVIDRYSAKDYEGDIDSAIIEEMKLHSSSIAKGFKDYIRKEALNLTSSLVEERVIIKNGDKYDARTLGLGGNLSLTALYAELAQFISADTISIMETYKVLLGDTLMFKNVVDRFKRNAAFLGTKSESFVDEGINQWIKDNAKRLDGAEGLAFNDKPIIRTMVYKDPNFISNNEQLGEGYQGEETDGGSSATLDFIRELYIRSGDWTFLKGGVEDLYQWESQMYGWYLVQIGEMTKEKFQSLYGAHDEKINWDAPYRTPVRKNGEVIERPSVSINTVKPQYYGDFAEPGVAVKAIYKTSFDVLIPSRWMDYTNPNGAKPNKYSHFDKLNRLMYKNGISIASAASANKGILTKLNKEGKIQELFNKTTGELLISDKGEYKDLVTQDIFWEFMGVQQETGFVSHNEASKGSQQGKQIINGIYDNGKAVNEELGALAEEYVSVDRELNGLRFNQLLNKLGIELTEDGYKTKDYGNLISMLTKQATDNNLPMNIVDAIQSLSEDISIDGLINSEKIEYILGSIIDSTVFKPKVFGKGAYQVPPTFFTGNRAVVVVYKQDNKAVRKEFKNNSEGLKEFTDELTSKNISYKQYFTSSDLKFYEKTKDGVSRMQVLLPSWFKGKVEIGDIPKELLQLVGFRIPTSGLNSIEAIEVVGFLPEGSGDMIVAPSELIVKAGSDFDIDKMYLHLKNFYISGGRVEYINPKVSYEEYIKSIDKGLKTDMLNTDKLLNENQYKLKQLENKLLELKEKIILHPANFEQLTTPVGVGSLGELKKYITKLIPSLDIGYDKMYNSIRRSTINNITTQNYAGVDAIGITALVSTFHIACAKHGVFVEDVPYKLEDNKGKLLYKTDNLSSMLLKHNKIDGKVSLGGYKDVEGNYIYERLSEYLNAAVDNAKELTLYILNAGPETLNTVLYMVQAGVPAKDVVLFMNQPVIREYLTKLEASRNKFVPFKNKAFAGKNKVISSLLTKYKDVEGITELNEKILEKDLTEKKLQGVVFREFLKYQAVSDAIGNAIRGLSYDNAGVGRNVAEILIKRTNTLNVLNEGIIGNYDKVMQDTSSYNSTYYQLANDTYEAIKPLFSTLTNPSIEKGLNRFSGSLLAEDYIRNKDYASLLNKWRKEIITYLLFNNVVSSNKVKSTSELTLAAEADRIIKDVPEFLNKIKNDPNVGKIFANNRLLKALYPVIDVENSFGTNSIKLLQDAYDSTYMNELTDDWRRLLFGSQAYEYKEGKNFGLDLIKFVIIQAGSFKNNMNFSPLIPWEIYLDIVKNVLPLYDNLSNTDINNYTELFKINNYNRQFMVKSISNKDLDEATRDGIYKVFSLVPEIANIKNAVERENKIEEYRSQGRSIYTAKPEFVMVENGEITKLNTNNIISTKNNISRLDYSKDILPSYTEMDTDIVNSPVNSQTTLSWMRGLEFIPYVVREEDLKNSDGSKRLAGSDNEIIKINSSISIEEFFNYFEGNLKGESSAQKKIVLQKLSTVGYNLNKIKEILSTSDRIKQFLALHEYDHIINKDRDVYWKSGKNLLTSDKIDIEVRATKNALDVIGNIFPESISILPTKTPYVEVRYPETDYINYGTVSYNVINTLKYNIRNTENLDVYKDSLSKLVDSLYEYIRYNRIPISIIEANKDNKAGGGSMIYPMKDGSGYIIELNMNSKKVSLELLHELLHITTNHTYNLEDPSVADLNEQLNIYYEAFKRKVTKREDFKKISDVHQQWRDNKISREQLKKELTLEQREIYHAASNAAEFISSFINSRHVQVEVETILGDTNLYQDLIKWIKDFLAKLLKGYSSVQRDIVINDIVEYVQSSKDKYKSPKQLIQEMNAFYGIDEEFESTTTPITYTYEDLKKLANELKLEFPSIEEFNKLSQEEVSMLAKQLEDKCPF